MAEPFVPLDLLGLLGFQGRRVLVTGASKGIGAATARLFGRLGAEVALAYQADEAGARAVAEGLPRARTFAADLASWDEGERLVDEVTRALGPIDACVLNHGIWKEAAIDQMTAAAYDETLDANLRGYFSVAGACARRMKEAKRGSIVFVSSTAGQRGEAMHAHYAATKGAIISLTKSLAPELAPHGIRVSCVAPGWVDTAMTAGALADEPTRAEIFRAIPLGRVGTPEEIAWPIVFLASDLASFVTGEIFNVNGGAVLVG